jgi:hypothetical protein
MAVFEEVPHRPAASASATRVWSVKDVNTTTAVSGRASSSARVAVTPSMIGMDRSIRTTCGEVARAISTASAPVGGLADNLKPKCPLLELRRATSLSKPTPSSEISRTTTPFSADSRRSTVCAAACRAALRRHSWATRNTSCSPPASSRVGWSAGGRSSRTSMLRDRKVEARSVRAVRAVTNPAVRKLGG